MSTKKIFSWLLLSAISGIGMIAFMVLAADDDPMNPLPFTQWILIKGIAAASIAALYFIARYCDRKGWLPEISEEDDLW